MSRFITWTGLSIVGLVALLVGGMMWGAQLTEGRVEQAVRQNFTAAGQLSRLQVEGEKMRRYEKEAFIYVSVPDKRNGYIKEFEASNSKLIELLDVMLAPSGRSFTDAERADMLKWKEAAVFYAGEFANLGRKAASASAVPVTPEQRNSLTVEYNEAIKAGKDRFRLLLTGTEKMRLEKESNSMAIAGELDAIFGRLRLGVLIGGLIVIGAVLFSLRERSLDAVRPRPVLAPNR